MMRSVLIFLLVLTAAAAAPAFDIKRLDRSVVRVQHILSFQGREIPGPHGSGFVLTEDGYVATNHHVVDLTGQKLPDGTRLLEIVVPDGSWSKRLKAKVVWSSKPLDLAILHVPELRRPPVTLSAAPPQSSPEKGDAVYALGFPAAGDNAGSQAALETTFTRGDVSKVAMGRGTRDGAERPIVQHTATLNPGNSGGPLFNDCNQVVAINTFSAASTLRLVRGPNGDMVAHGAAVSGVHYSPHVSTLIRALTTEPELRNLRFQSAAQPCTRADGIPMWMYAAIGAMAVLALISLTLALVRKRGAAEVVRVVESYSQWMRRKTGQAAPRRPERVAREVPAPAGFGAGWVLAGTDGSGAPVALFVDRTELYRATQGPERGLLIGRSKALAQLVLADNSVSRRHARLSAAGEGVAIEDLGSSFGVTVDGRALAPYQAVAIAAGAKIGLGDVRLVLAWRDA